MPYGQFGETSTLSGFPYRYTGPNLDFETGLYHYRARAYSPAIGRFLQIDPKSYEPGPNLYAYVLNDPLNHTDPIGLCGTPCLVAGGLLVSGATVGVGAQYVANLALGQSGSAGNYLSAGMSGAALAVTAFTGASPLGLTVAGTFGAAGSFTGQVLDSGLSKVSYGMTLISGAINAAVTLVPGGPIAANSLNAFGKNVVSQLKKDAMTKISAATFAKAITGLAAGDAHGGLVGSALDYVADAWFSGILGNTPK